MKTRIEMLKDLVKVGQKRIERFNYLTSLTDTQLEKEYTKTFN